MSLSSRARALVRVMMLLSPALVAACLGGRGPRRPAAGTPQTPSRADSAIPVVVPPVSDSATRANVARDSAVKIADSLKNQVADSAKKDSAKTPVKVAPKKPAKQCVLDIGQLPETRFNFLRLADSSTNLMVGGGFVGHCVGEKNNVRADSAEYFETNGLLHLFGNVTYEEKAELRVTANRATYFLNEGKLYADGNVIASQLKSGSTFSGPNIEYFRVMPDVRTTSRLYAPNSPLVLIQQKDSVGNFLPPVRVGASVMEDRGDSVLLAWGSVNITRTDIVGRGDSASFDKPSGQARLIRAANIQSVSKEQPFTLVADTIDMFTTDSVLDRVLAKHRARATSGDITMTAERLDMRLVDRKINRAYAFGTGRAKAVTKAQTLEADSLDILIPEQRIKELRAFGAASAISKPDSATINSDENDILRGDVIIAEFDSVRAPNDTAAKAQIRRVTADGNASSKVQIASRQGAAFPPAINYIRGKHLIVTFDSGQVRDIAVDSSASGQYFEPVADTLSDSTARNKPRRPPPTALRTAPRADSPLPDNPPSSIRARSAAMMPSRSYRNR
ncbi:MAG: hypothetical protein H7Z40_00860 [Phycisphaerae bacterium]|nr:hypothetical protein [Gemmatimonadaceae bacterium]